MVFQKIMMLLLMMVIMVMDIDVDDNHDDTGVNDDIDINNDY